MSGDHGVVTAVVVVVLIFVSSHALAQPEFDEQSLRIKQRFAEMEDSALAEPFVGVRTESGIQTGLYSIKSTGVPTSEIRRAAESLLGSLSSTQILRTQFPVDHAEWRRWSNVDSRIYARRGVSLEEMNERQYASAIGLMTSSLSDKGYKLSRNIMKTDQTLNEINGYQVGFGEKLYYFTIMGIPSALEPWGWQLDGHHLIINFFVLNDQVVTTPMFVGGEPVVTESGKYAGNAVLQDEQNEALAFMQSLDNEQRAMAVIDSKKNRNNMRAGAGKDNLILNYAGLPATALDEDQTARLLSLMGLYVRNLNDGHARIWMADIQQHLEHTYFAWVGGTSDDAVFYYRIHSPVILIEFDHQRPVGMRSLLPDNQPTRHHIHAVVRTPNGNDYGKDLLRQHLEEHAH